MIVAYHVVRKLRETISFCSAISISVQVTSVHHYYYYLLPRLLDDHVQDRCTLIGPTSGTKHCLYHGTQYDVHRTRFSSRHTYRSYLGGIHPPLSWGETHTPGTCPGYGIVRLVRSAPSHIETLLLILFAHVHLEYEDEHGTASLGTSGRSSQASRRDTSASERLQVGADTEGGP